MTRETIPTYCALCISRWGSVGTVEDGILTRVDPDPLHPTGRALCAKAKAASEAVYHPERILHPLRRTTPKGSEVPGWERISWDEALDLITEKVHATFARHGATGLAFGVATPSGTAVADSFAWIHRLAHACKSPNLVFATENCNWHKDFRLEGYWEHKLKPWDVAAGGLIVREAGGLVTDRSGGPGWRSGAEIVATNGALQGVLLAVLADAQPR